MDLTDEQRAIVEVAEGRHLVLAPPGSGKTEMLSQRIRTALAGGVPPERMLCATFTNRAAFEMRERVVAEGGTGPLPDVGNLHHFCERFLRQVGLLHSGRHVVDEVEQRDMAREVLAVLREELRMGLPSDLKRTHGVTVLAHLVDRTEDRVHRMREDLETFLARCRQNGVDAASCARAGMSVIHQRRIGIPRRLESPWPQEANALWSMGALGLLEKAYRGLKRRFLALDLDDLLNETYLRLLQHPLADEERFSWVQVDEVQDLNPLQWAIVRELTAAQAVSVYFGDLEQSIFSFMGASLSRLEEATEGCLRHDFRLNFRATPLLLEVLMRYSLAQLHSKRAFISEPADFQRENGVMRLLAEGSTETVLGQVRDLLGSGRARDVAVLVRTNGLADDLARELSRLPWRSVKVSGFELGFFRPMRDFLAFVDLFSGRPSRIAWTALVRRFGAGIRTTREARYFVRDMFAAGWRPENLLAEDDGIPLFPASGGRAGRWAWRNRRVLQALRRALRPMCRQGDSEALAFHGLFARFAKVAFDAGRRYDMRELLPDAMAGTEGEVLADYEGACLQARMRIEKFLRYADHVHAQDGRPFAEFLHAEWPRLRRAKEADMLVGDERIVVSTIHKAKGRQFDGVVLPEVSTFLRDEETRRLLYVGMSRARRHLVLLGAKPGGPVDDIAECFSQSYTGYYLRKARGADLSEDWLWQWERLAALNTSRSWDAALVEQGLDSARNPVVTMALRVARHWVDAAGRRKLYQRHLPREDLSACVIDCLRETVEYDLDMLEAVRKRTWGTVRTDIWMSALEYYRGGLAAGGDTALLCSICLGDGLYAGDGEVRLSAAEALEERNWRSVIRGTPSDFARLGLVPDREHEDAIRGILAHPALPRGYASNLRQVLLARSFR